MEHQAIARARVTVGRYVRDGTLDIMLGSAVAGLGAYAYQVWGGRVLGANDFAPFSMLLTVHFLAFAVVLLPVEQLVTRRQALGVDDTAAPPSAIWAIAVMSLAAAGFVLLTVDRLFEGDTLYAVAAAGTVLTHGLFSVGRGHLIGHGRYRAYGAASAAAAIFRLLVTGAIVAAGVTAIGLTWALVIGPLAVLAWRPFRAGNGRVPARDRSGRLLVGMVLAAAAAQLLLLSGALVAGWLGDTPAEVSIVFATFTLFRAPLVLGYNLLARVLKPFTAMAARGDHHLLAAWGRGLTAGGVVTAVAAAGAGYVLGPPILALVFGAEFRPEAAFAALVAAGVVLAVTGAFQGQILVARDEGSRLAGAWFVAVLAGAAALALPLDDVDLRVGMAFLIGEAVAVVLLAGAALVPAHPGRATPGYVIGKRALDLVVGGTLTLLTLPLVPLVALAVRLDSRGPALFRQLRVGQDGRHFRMWKFRTMQAGADEEVLADHLRRVAAGDTAGLKVTDDPRITRVGRLLRRWSLDELPNLWNVVGGSMSLVGPRPLVPMEIEVMGEASRRRLEAKPGVTGLAQIMGRDEIAMSRRTDHDLDYLERRSFGLDLWILVRTVIALFRQPGR